MPKTKLSEIFDIAVVGGGPAGKIAALSFARRGFSSILVAPAALHTDGRTTALWQKSLSRLEELGVWPAIEKNAASLEKMRMIDDTRRLVRAPEVVFDSSELNIDRFGFNILNSELNLSLEEKCKAQDGLTLLEDNAASAEFTDSYASVKTTGGKEIRSCLLIAADGRNSVIRGAAGIDVKRWSYPQVAVVLNLDHRLPHRNVSTEFHTPTGPFTLVPLPGLRSSLVCVETADGANELISMETAELELELERRAHSILGSFKLASEIQSYPLSGLTAEKLVSSRLALIAETAHVFPPIGAQGLNLSLRDISDLVDIVSRAKARRQDFAAPDVLAAYEAKRFRDIKTRTNAVDVLNRSLLTEFLPVQLARSTGMYLAGKVGPLRRLLMREGMTPGSGFPLLG